MINLLLHRKTNDSFKFIADNWKLNDLIVVTPNPGTADLVRNNFDKLGKSVSSITISKFMKDELNELLPDDVLENYKGKSEILFLLGAVWKNLHNEDDYIAFKRAFNILTEFRSYSVEESVLETVLENYDEELAHGVLWLNRFMENLSIVDEHKSYFLLAEILRAGDLPPSYKSEKNIVFYGFDFLTASQIDLLKALGLRSTIIIPFFKDVYEKSVAVDWVNWFDEHNLKILDIVQDKQIVKDYKILEFAKNYLATELDSFEDLGTVDSIVLANRGLTREVVQEVPLANFHYKVSIDIFSEKFEQIKNSIYLFVKNKSVETINLQAEVKNILDLSIKENDFRAIKVVLLLLKKLNDWDDLSEKHKIINSYDLEIIFESLFLDLPRTNLTTLDSRSTEKKIMSLMDLDSIKKQKVIWAMSSDHSGFMGVGGNFSDSVEKYLGAIGPIRRADLDLLIAQSRFNEFLEDNDVVFMIQKGLLKEKAQLSKIFEGLSLVPSENKLQMNQTKKVISLDKRKEEISYLSASRLQKYKDCPLKYYVSYIEKIEPRVKLPSQIDVLELGSMEHKIIEEYFKATSGWDESSYELTVNNIFQQKVGSQNIVMSEKILVELFSYTKQTIQNLVLIKEKLNLDYYFEHSFNSNPYGVGFTGSIDLYAKNENLNLIIDFKRSDRLFNSYTKMEERESIQLWFYFSRLKELGKIDVTKSNLLGYINLSDFSTSRLLTNDKFLEKHLKDLLGIPYIKCLEDFDELVEEYQESEKLLIERLQIDNEFKAKPFNKSVCDFCSIKNVCERG